MNANTNSAYLKKIGSRILGEANDLKRTTRALADELGRNLEQIEAVIAGEAGLEVAQQVIRDMAATYPISLSDLWLEADDTEKGVLIVTEAESRASSRVFDRVDATGGLSHYYEYRDTAMSRTAPFKPEWIKELRVVNDSSAHSKDVAYNNGHLMHQTTFFIGPVNFYWQTDEARHCAELNTGDSNYVTPFVPHSFTSRDPSELGLILAVTYGGDVRRAMSDFSHLDGETVESLAADPRQPHKAFVQLLNRQLAAESLTGQQFVEALVDIGFDLQRAEALTTDGDATPEEIKVVAGVLNISQKDLTVSPMTEGAEVVVKHRAGAAKRYYPDAEAPAYEITELARTSLQPFLKGLDLIVLDDTGDMRHSLHQYSYNYGDSPVRMVWADGESATLNPGDSAYVRPMVKHRFEPAEGERSGQMVVMRIPGGLSGQVMAEYSAYAPPGRKRVGGETRQWF